MSNRDRARSVARQGEPGQALRHYQSLLALLADDLGSALSLEASDLHNRVRRDEPN